MLVEKDKDLDLKQALQLAADVQPIKVEAGIVDDVRTLSSHSYFINMISSMPFLYKVMEGRMDHGERRMT